MACARGCEPIMTASSTAAPTDDDHCRLLIERESEIDSLVERVYNKGRCLTMKISIAAILLVSCSLVLADATTTTTQRHLRGAEEEEAEQARHLQTIILAGGDSFLGQNGETCPIQDPDKTCPSVVDPVVCRGCRVSYTFMLELGTLVVSCFS